MDILVYNPDNPTSVVTADGGRVKERGLGEITEEEFINIPTVRVLFSVPPAHPIPDRLVFKGLYNNAEI